MTRADLIAAVQRAADEPLGAHTPRRRGMPAHVAERCIAAVVEEVLAIVEPFALNQWGGDVVLKRVRELRPDAVALKTVAKDGEP